MSFILNFCYYFVICKLKFLNFYNSIRSIFLFFYVAFFLSIYSFLRFFQIKNFYKKINYLKIFINFYELFYIKILLAITAMYIYFFIIFFLSILFEFDVYLSLEHLGYCNQFFLFFYDRSCLKLYFFCLLSFFHLIILVHITLGLLSLFYDYLLKNFSKDNHIFLGFLWYRLLFLVLKIFLIIFFLIIIF